MSVEAARESRWNELQDLARRGAFFGALVRAGLILKDLDDERSHAERKEWIARIVAVSPNREILEELEIQARQNLERAEHIMSCGSDFEVEEFALVLTLRLDTELAKDAATALGAAWGDISFESVDERLLDAATSSRTQRLFASAQRLIRRNIGLGLNMKWLSSPGGTKAGL